MEIKFKRDTSFRKQFFVPDSFAHPAKMDAQLLIWIVERYTQVGETILDPMAGSGTMMLACGLGRNVVLVELEDKFCKMMRDNWEEARMRPQLGYSMGNCQIIQGDARNLKGLFDKCIFSPPYAEAIKPREGDKALEKFAEGYTKGSCITQSKYGYSENDSNIGNLPYGSIDKIVTSPPYGNPRDVDEKSERDYENKRLGEEDKQHGRTQFRGRYEVDAVITSPPYEASVTGKSGIDWTKATRGAKEGWKPRDRTKEASHEHLAGQGQPFNYSESQNNIGNLKSDSYLQAMLQVYQQCHSVLKPGGLMILVTKNFIRNKQVIRLDTDTIKLCEQAGFSYLERHYRKLPSQSFWRVIYHQKHPEVEVLEHEDVLVFRKVELKT